MQVFVIIPAAGLGTRMSAPAAFSPTAEKPLSKQFTELHGTPIVVHTLRKFAESPQVSAIYVATRANEFERFRSLIAAESFSDKVRLVEGGENRQESVARALDELGRGGTARSDDVVLVHDAVRPFVEAGLIREVIEAVERHGAAIAGMPAVDTVKQVDRTADGALITATIPRERVVLAQTPQGFRYELLKGAFDDAAAIGFTGTDEASLVERLGHEVVVVMGSPRNIKITTPSDLELAEYYAQEENRRRVSLTG